MLSDEREAKSAMMVWAENLKPFTDAQIETALQCALRRHPSWPPTLGEFMQLARGDAGIIRHAKDIINPTIPPPPMTSEEREAIKSMMKKTRAMMSGIVDDVLGF